MRKLYKNNCIDFIDVKHVFTSFCLLIFFFFSISTANSQICPDYDVVVSANNTSKCYLILIFDENNFPEIGCPTTVSPESGAFTSSTPAPGSAPFSGELLYLQFMTNTFGVLELSEIFFDNSANNCSSARLYLEGYHSTIPNAIVTSLAEELVCNLFSGDPGNQSWIDNTEVSTIITIQYPDGSQATEECTDGIPTPVEWVSFIANENERRAIDLEWKVASQLNNKLFEVQHSHDGQVFRTIDIVEGDGTLSTERIFSYTHTNPRYGNNYYRLRQLDFDGTFDFSEVISIVLDNNRIANLFPSVVLGNEVGIELNTTKDFATTEISIVDITGYVVHQETMQTAAGISLHRIDLPKLDAGVYIVYVKMDGEHTETYKMMKIIE